MKRSVMAIHIGFIDDVYRRDCCGMWTAKGLREAINVSFLFMKMVLDSAGQPIEGDDTR
jgi:hypothetical protein